MPNFDILKSFKPNFKSFRVASVKGMFNLQEEEINERFTGKIDLENFNWNVGVIYGASGTGKSTIAKELFGANYIAKMEYGANSVIDDMPQNVSVKDICQTFSSVGFSSPKSWLKPYSVLSNGEKMRVDLATAILSPQQLVVFDEYTSVVNREVAKVGSFALQKAVRKSNKKFVAVSCHDDVIDWLEPDWIFCTDTMTFSVCKKKDLQFQCPFIGATKPLGECILNTII